MWALFQVSEILQFTQIYIHHGDLSEEVSDDHFSIPCHDFFPEFQWGGRTSPSQTGENTLSLGFHFGGTVGIEIASFMIAKLGRARTL